MSPVPQPISSYEADQIRQRLRGRADYIEQKFHNRRAYDVNSSHLDEVLGDLAQLSEAVPASERDALRRIGEIEDLCYAAISNYQESENRPTYFKQLRRIAQLVKRV